MWGEEGEEEYNDSEEHETEEEEEIDLKEFETDYEALRQIYLEELINLGISPNIAQRILLRDMPPNALLEKPFTFKEIRDYLDEEVTVDAVRTSYANNVSKLDNKTVERVGIKFLIYLWEKFANSDRTHIPTLPLPEGVSAGFLGVL